MKKLSLTVFTVICALCMIFGVSLMANINRANAETTAGTTPTLSATKVMVSNAQDKMLLATAIKDKDDVYEVGYTFTGEITPSLSENGKYYSSITSGTTTLLPADIFDEDWAANDGVGMIIWEIPFSAGTPYGYKPYALVGDRVNGNLVVPATENRVTPENATEKTFYTVTFSANEAEYGSVSKMSVAVPSGSAISVSENVITVGGIAVNATKNTDNAQYTYGFTGFDYEGETVTANTTITANFTRTTNEYTVTFKNYNGAELQSGSVAYGIVPVYSGETPTMPNDAQYTYGEFTGWDSEIVTVTGDTVYTATYNNKTVNQYTITFKNSDGTTIKSSNVNYGETPSCEQPFHPNADDYNYVFTGWSDGENGIAPVSGAKTYTATYTTTRKAISTAAEFFDMNTIKDGTYYLANDIDFDGETITPIGVWNDKDEFTGTFDGKGYALLNVSVSDATGGLFAANKGTIENVYVDLYSTGTLLSNVKRYGFVQINLEEGTISNVFSNFHQNHTSENDRYGVIYGAIAGQNYGGTIENCVGEVTAAANLAYVYTDLIVGENTGTITNCYGITNGNSDLVISHRNSGTVMGATYADAILVIDDEVITAGNGFDMDYWTVSGSTMYMRTRAVVSNGVTVFTQDNVSDFFTTINANKSGYYILGEDVDFTGVTAAEIGAWDGVNEFKGTFNGRGYKMTNLSISNSVRGIFYANEGTVKNVYAEISTTTTINANQHTGFVAVNCAHGTVSDVYVRLTMDYGTNSDAYGMRLGAVVGSNKGGTIENCVGELIISNTVANEVIRGLQYLYVGLIVGINDSGSVINSYGIKNGPVYADYNKTALNAVKANAATVTGCAVYDNVKAMINADVVKAANGFNMRLWNVSDGKVYLGENIVGMTVFTQANISTFFTTIGKYVGGYYILDSDLDFTDVAVSKIGTWSNQYTEFYGTFDGQGYAMTGIKLTADNSCVFLANAGVIKNVYAEMTVVEDITADTYIGLVGMSLNIGTTEYSDGIVSNVYAKLNVAHNITSSRFAAAVVGRAFGTISNCIGEVVIGAGVSSYADTSAIYAYNNGATVTGCYGICANASIPTYSGVNNNYASASALVTAVGANITAANGFDMNYWSVDTDNNSISFGGKTI